MELFSKIGDVLKAPFVGQLDMKQYFLIIGFTLLAIAVWIFIIHSIKASVAIASEAI